jgi:hypothetical protein
MRQQRMKIEQRLDPRSRSTSKGWPVNISNCEKFFDLPLTPKNRPSGAKAVTAKFSNTGKYTKLKNVKEKRVQELLLDLAAQLA